jgi:repressor LexA
MSRPPSTLATPRQREILEWIKEFILAHKMPPTVREIGDAFGIKSSSVFQLLKELERKGYVERGSLGARSLTVRDQGAVACDCVEIPVIGRIAAGNPLEAVEDTLGTLHISRDLLGGSGGYALRIAGDSMIDAGILDGDCVIVRRQETARDGDIVVALIGEEATLKRFYREDGGIRLEPANESMRPIRVRSGEFRIQGKVVGVQRSL